MTRSTATKREVVDEHARVEALATAHAALQSVCAELERTQDSLIQASRLAGIAEVATNVLHGVGNALNSANVSADRLSRQIETSTLCTLRRTAALIGDELPETASDRVRKALVLIDRLLLSAEQERRAAADEARNIRASVEHIKAVVAAQRKHAGVRDAAERVDLVDLVEEVVETHELELAELGISLVVDIEDIAFDLMRHKVILVLSHLLANARDAVSAEERREIRIEGGRDGEKLGFALHDSGPGVPVALREKIFAHGFTSKPGAHGFGLHASANAAQQMGGTLQLAAQGDLGGATFQLVLPAARR